MRPIHTLAALGLLAAPALAQTADSPLPSGVDQTQQGTPIGIEPAPGLPGVGLEAQPDSTADSQEGLPKGAGGLQNGVGGEGTLAPSTTGSNDDILDSSQTDDSGVPVVD